MFKDLKLRFKTTFVAAIVIFSTLNFLPSFAEQTKVTSQIISGNNVNLDTDLYLPSKIPAPAILLAHGFGGSKESTSDEAKKLQDLGYVVMTYSARGFGKSTGLISMNNYDLEVADATKLVDFLAANTDVAKDKQGQPLIGVTGASYGGALSLMLAAKDSRIKAIASDITWNSLRNALFPQYADSSKYVSAAGPFKRVWAGSFFNLTALQNTYLGQCGNFEEKWCQSFKDSMAGKSPTPEELQLLAQSSPSQFISSINAPTLLMQGQSDSLFPLSESLANAQVLKEKKVPVSLFWHAGGHDGGNIDDLLIFQATVNWFDKYLKGKALSIPAFQVTDSQGSLSVTDSTAIATELVGKSVPGSIGEKIQTLSMEKQLRPFFNPIGAAPAALTALPGLGGISSALNGIAGSLGGGNTFGNLGNLGDITPSLLPGQSAQFESQQISAPFNIVGSPKISVKITSTNSDATLFFSLLVKSQSGLRSTSSAVAPVKLENIPKDGADIQLTLPAVFAKVSPGESLVVGVSATDQGFLMPIDGRLYTVAPLTDLSVPTMELAVMTSGKAQFVWPMGALISLIFALLYYFWRRPQRKALAIDNASDSTLEIGESDIKKNQTIIEISNLSKVYQDGFQAVSDLSFKVGKGQVVGLLGPNGAGKTTTLRMLMGLIWPTAGEIKINGKSVYPGSPALAQLGSFVEGPGLLPHLTGRENLEIYWRAVGRTQDARLDEVIAITKLGSALDKKVRSYSQGMRQRIAIAQSMMGLPDVLILDEPTNGLDPQQIAEMRKVLKDYAKSGRTVVISSHLLAEVEQTCSHVVLMHRGQLIAAGTMRNIIKDAKNLEEIFLELIGDDLIIGQGKQ